MTSQSRQTSAGGGQATRRYRKRRRAKQEADTRRRITEAAVKLHGTVGPGRTSVKQIAEEAGVQRATVYRHFPDEDSLFEACTSHYFALNPMPDPGAWGAIGNPEERLRIALGELYQWFGRTEPMITNSIRDLDQVPAATRDGFLAYFDVVRGALMRGRPERGRARQRTSAAIGHAVDFTTWRSLTRVQGLGESEALELMAGMVEAAQRRSRPASRSR
jgi:AcrR family transcriptional regulator